MLNFLSFHFLKCLGFLSLFNNTKALHLLVTLRVKWNTHHSFQNNIIGVDQQIKLVLQLGHFTPVLNVASAPMVLHHPTHAGKDRKTQISLYTFVCLFTHLAESSQGLAQTIPNTFYNKIFIYLAVLSLSCSMCTLSYGMWDLVPWPGIEPGPLQWEGRVLATGPPGKSSLILFDQTDKTCTLIAKNIASCMALGNSLNLTKTYFLHSLFEGVEEITPRLCLHSKKYITLCKRYTLHSLF